MVARFSGLLYMKYLQLIAPTVLILVIISGVIWYGATQGVAVLEPQGTISSHQRDLFILAVVLGLTALVPVFAMAILIINRYQSGHKDKKKPNRSWSVPSAAGWVWGVFVSLIIAVLAVVLVQSTIAIDPYNPIESDAEPLRVQVIALPWKWLFLYPDDGIASVNELVIPVNTPISLELTADAPMSSFWIPKLGGMIYVMEGMVTKHHLMATSEGEFTGTNTEINGEGYSHMKFTTRSVNQDDYHDWVEQASTESSTLDEDAYAALAKPSVNQSKQFYTTYDHSIFGQVLSKFMMHEDHGSESHSSNSNNHH